MPTAFHEILKDAAQPIWEAILAHPYLKELGAGTLPHDRFLYFIRQDYLYLFEFARVLCAGGSKAEDLDTLEMFAKHAANTVAVERVMHTGFIQRLGLQADHLLDSERTPTTQAYTRHLLAVAREGTLGEIVAAVLPCYWIYLEVGRHLAHLSARAIRFIGTGSRPTAPKRLPPWSSSSSTWWIAWEHAPLPMRADA